MSAEQSNEGMFQGLVVSLAAATMQHLGKTLNPMTSKVEKNLPAAQSTIDMLDMLEAKTKGNLTETEAKLLQSVLAELKLNYVETMNDKPADDAKIDAPASEANPESPAESKSAETASGTQPEPAEDAQAEDAASGSGEKPAG